MNSIICLVAETLTHNLTNWSRKIVAVLATSLFVAGSVEPAFAEPPLTFSEVLDVTIPAPVTRAACGFSVFHRLTGTFTVTLFNQGGDLVVREIDGAKDARDTWFAPTQGTSYSYPFNGATRFSYPEGAFVGAPAFLILDLLVGKVPGQPADAGRLVFEGIVVFVTPDGIPIVDTDPTPVSQHGSIGNAGPLNRCAALAAP